MPVEVISIGPPTTLLQNVVYALPAVKVLLTAEGSPTLQQSNLFAFTTPITTTLTLNQVTVGGGFIRSTAGNAVITLKRD